MSEDKGKDIPRLPSHIAYNVEDGREIRDCWQRIGRAWKSDDGDLSIRLSATPINGHVVLRPRNTVASLKKSRRPTTKP